jgi:hypothetical protein
VLSEKAKELGMSAVAGRFRQQIGEISKQQRMIKFAPPPWTAEQKRAEIDRLQQLKLQLAAQFETLAQ